MPANHVLKVDSYVPFGSTICWWLQIAQDQNLDALIKQSRQYDHAYLAWETVRKRRNPFFDNGTGFEGYLVGLCRSPDEALDQLLQISRGMLISVLRLHRTDPRFKSKLIKVLLDESDSPQAIAEWSTQLGATLARLRCNLRQARQAADFHSETHRIVTLLPPIDYRAVDDTMKQVYVLDGHDSGLTQKMLINSESLKWDDQEAWLVAQSVGKFGHPLVRTFVNRCLGS